MIVSCHHISRLAGTGDVHYLAGVDGDIFDVAGNNKVCYQLFSGIEKQNEHIFSAEIAQFGKYILQKFIIDQSHFATFGALSGVKFIDRRKQRKSRNGG